MHLGLGRQLDLNEAADLHPGFSVSAPVIPAQHASPAGGYATSRRPNWPVIGLIAALHIVALIALTTLDIVPLAKAKPAPVLVTLIPDQATPPPAPAPRAKLKPEKTPPPDAPPPAIVTTAVLPQAPQITVTPVPPAPVVAAPIAAPPAPPAPIVPPDASAATLHNPPPAYPVESRRRHEEGTVRLRVVITVDGRVKDIAVARSSGFERLDRAALNAVRHWRFSPGTQAGVPVEAVGTLSIPFRLT